MKEKISGSVHQILHGMYLADAITNDAFEIQKILRESGYKSEIFANLDFVCPECRKKVFDYKEYKKYSSDDSILIYHYSTHSPITDFVVGLLDKLVLRYHNVTPADYFHFFSSELKGEMDRGRRDLLRLRDRVAMVLADSEYNRIEIEKLGFKNTFEFPIAINFDKFGSKCSEKVLSKYGDGFTNIIFVGRVAPNKKYEDLLKVFYYFSEINKKSRLILVGSYESAREYYSYLKYVESYLGLENVIYTGIVTLSELISYYKVSDLFLCMSEHEGFCVPLVEAMYFRVPIIACDFTAVPYTLGGAGILVHQKKFVEIAELMDVVIKNENLRAKIVDGQTQRLNYFSKDNVRNMLNKFVKMLSGN